MAPRPFRLSPEQAGRSKTVKHTGHSYEDAPPKTRLPRSGSSEAASQGGHPRNYELTTMVRSSPDLAAYLAFSKHLVEAVNLEVQHFLSIQVVEPQLCQVLEIAPVDPVDSEG